MVDVSALASAALQNVGAPGAQAPVPAPKPDVAAADEVARFDAALQGGAPQPDAPPPGEAQPSGDVQRPGDAQGPGDAQRPGDVQFEPVQQTASVGAPSSPGDAILRGLERMSSDFKGAVDNIAKTAQGAKPGEMMSASDLMRMQFALTQVTMQQDVTAKVVGKATQNLDTFLKNQ